MGLGLGKWQFFVALVVLYPRLWDASSTACR